MKYRIIVFAVRQEIKSEKYSPVIISQ